MNKTRKPSRMPVVPLAIICAVALAAGWMIDRSGLAALKAQSDDALSALVISEVQNHNALTLSDDDGTACGWIEIQNTGADPVALGGVCLTRDSRLNKTFVFPKATLGAGETALVYADGSAERARGGHYCAPFRLPKSGGTALFLYDDEGRLLDSVDVPAMEADEALCRDREGSWSVTDHPTPGKPNDTADQLDAEIRPGDAIINEVMADNRVLFPDEDGDYDDYIELCGVRDDPVRLKGYWLTDNAAKPNKWQLPDVTLRPGECLAIHCSGKDRRQDPAHLHANFRLSVGETVYLAQPDGTLVASVTLDGLETGQAISRVGDGFTTALPPTPGLPNTMDSVRALDAQAIAQRPDGVMISEALADPGDEGFDWVELYNGGGAEVDLSGCGLSNRLGRVRRWQFPAGTTLGAGQRLAVQLLGASDASTAGTSGKWLTAPFCLPADDGCTVSLCDPEGRVLDALCLPRQYPGVSYGRDGSGGLGYFEAPTPGQPNGQALREPVDGAAYSVPGGLYSAGDSFQVTLTAPAGGRIYYTLDCSDPDERKTLYTGAPIQVTGTTILRTRVYQDGYLPSIMDTQSYLYDVPHASDAPYVVSLVSDPDGLYSDERGILVMGPNAFKKFPYGDYGKGANFWMDWERESHVEIFTGAGDRAVSQECGIKLHGRNTRAYDLKGIKVLARARYGDDRFRYPLFRERPYDEYEAFLLRYSGQDYKYTFMRDVVMTNQAKNTGVMYMEAEESIVYLNGEYYSAMYIRENISPFSLSRREGWLGQEDDLDLVKSGLDVKQGSNDSYQLLKEYLRSHDNASQEVYDRIAAEVDIDNFIDFITLQVFYIPPDTVNVKRYRNPDADGLWRWVLYDLDRGLRNPEKDALDGFSLMAQGTNADLFNAFMAHPALRDRFIDNLDKALSTYLSSQALLEAVDAQLERVRPLLPDYLANVGVAQEDYQRYLDSLRSIIRRRPKTVLKHCAAFLNLTEADLRARFPNAVAEIERFAAENG